MRSTVRVELVLVLIPLILLSIFTCSARGMLCNEAEREALLDFKLSFTVDPLGYLSSWNAHNPDCCTQWDGVECDDHSGHVNSIDFSYFSLGSHQLRPSLIVMQHLTFLQLSDNNFTMRIPEFIGSLANLEYLCLSNSGFYGKIPPHLGNLTHLQTLVLEGVLHSDSLQWLPHMSSLQSLELGGVNLSTTTDWISSLKRLPFISDFTCSSCSFPLTPQPVSSTCPHNHSITLQRLDLSSSQISTTDFLCLINGTYSLTDLTLASMNQNPDDFFRPLFQSATWSWFFPWLQILAIPGNQLSEFMPAPQNSSTMPLLETLDISLNLMTTIPTFPNLLDLDASFNRLINVSLHFSCMQNLQSLKISNNFINALPDLSKLSSLDFLNASFNSLNIISDSDFSKLSNLQFLDFSYNHLLTFNFSRSWVPLFNLLDLRLRSCNIGPHFPNWVWAQKGLQYLDISNSSILGVIPDTFWNGISNLENLNFSHNKIQGKLPNVLTRFPKYSEIDLSFNSFHGPIPLFLFSAKSLDLSNNNFSSFSMSYHKVPKNDVEVINLSSNLLLGSLPGWIFHFNGLRILNLANNKLSGDIPSSIGSSRELKALHMNNNRFSGELPSSMKNCTQLVILELGTNNFSGSLPLWIGDSLDQLFAINLRSNNFTGELPSNLCNLQSLQVLDLSGNRLLGSIPDCVDNFTSMIVDQSSYFTTTLTDISLTDIFQYFVGYAMIMWKGILEHESGVLLPQMVLIDLSSNRLTGTIPSGFTTLTSLRSLDLSSNDLNGSIPDKIGQLKYLEVLKLSSNRLGGEIPQSLADLTFLNTLNVSSNNLSGEIPKSTQLQSLDPSSYGENPELCGEPLPTLCPWDKGTIKPPPSVKDCAEEGQESFDFEAFYAALGAGFASGLFGILGILHFHAPSRHAFFHMASEVGDWIFIWTMLYKYRIKRRLCFSKEKEAAKL